MMTFLFWLIVLGVLGFVGMRLSRQWSARQQGEQPVTDLPTTDSATTKSNLNQLTAMVASGVAKVRSKLLGEQQTIAPADLRAWMAKAFTSEPQLHHWLAGLSDAQLTVLTNHIDGFCREMGFELRWLVDPGLAPQPALAQALNKVVIYYCQACHQSVGLQEELEPYRLLREYEENPNSQPNRALGQELFRKFAEQGLTAVSMAEHLALSEQARRQQVFATVRQVAIEKQGTLLHLIKEVITQPDGTAKAAAHNGTTNHGSAAAPSIIGNSTLDQASA